VQEREGGGGSGVESGEWNSCLDPLRSEIARERGQDRGKESKERSTSTANWNCPRQSMQKHAGISGRESKVVGANAVPKQASNAIMIHSNGRSILSTLPSSPCPFQCCFVAQNQNDSFLQHNAQVLPPWDEMKSETERDT